jgi:hypothetical protein
MCEKLEYFTGTSRCLDKNHNLKKSFHIYEFSRNLKKNGLIQDLSTVDFKGIVQRKLTGVKNKLKR